MSLYHGAVRMPPPLCPPINVCPSLIVSSLFHSLLSSSLSSYLVVSYLFSSLSSLLSFFFRDGRSKPPTRPRCRGHVWVGGGWSAGRAGEQAAGTEQQPRSGIRRSVYRRRSWKRRERHAQRRSSSNAWITAASCAPAAILVGLESSRGIRLGQQSDRHGEHRGQ